MTMDNQNNAQGLLVGALKSAIETLEMAAKGDANTGILKEEIRSIEKVIRASEVDALLASRPAAPSEAQVQLEVWQSAFGTNQLSHALARLEAAEKYTAQVLRGEVEGALEVLRRAIENSAESTSRDSGWDDHWMDCCGAKITDHGTSVEPVHAKDCWVQSGRHLLSGTPVAPQDVVANAREFIAAAKIEGNKKGMGGYMFARMKDLESALDAHPQTPALPRVWTAETIWGAPDGFYQAGFGDEWLDGYSKKEYWTGRLSRKFAPWPAHTRFFGPIVIPQPPASKEEA